MEKYCVRLTTSYDGKGSVAATAEAELIAQ
jgi:hypothetical protein